MFRIIAILLVLALSVQTPQAAKYNYYGAIAISPSNGYAGSGLKRVSYENAKSWALYNCGKYADDCTVAVYFVNICAAVARGQNGGYAAGKSLNLSDAHTSAVRSCSTVDSGCRVIISGCSKP
jgi:serine/threonine-protein kinase